MSGSLERAGVVPATVSFLAVYNPTLSSSDETFEDQIVYYHSKPRVGRGLGLHGKDVGDNGESKEEKEEKLRQIGLAQGMVSFAKYWSLTLSEFGLADRLEEISPMDRQWTPSKPRNLGSSYTSSNRVGGYWQ